MELDASLGYYPLIADLALNYEIYDAFHPFPSARHPVFVGFTERLPDDEGIFRHGWN